MDQPPSRSPRARFRGLTLAIGSTSSWELAPELAVTIVDKLGKFVRDASPLAREALPSAPLCHLVGGEPFSDVDAVTAVARVGRQHGLITQVSTQGLWGLDVEQRTRTFDTAGDSVSILVIAVSARRARRHGVEHVEALVHEAHQRDVRCSIHLILDDGADWPRELVALRTLNEQSLTIAVAPSYRVPVGESSDEWLLEEVPQTRCLEHFGLVVSAAADVFPCAAMLGIEHMRLGNIVDDGVEEVVARALSRVDLHDFAARGPIGLKRAAISQGHGDLLPGAFIDTCDFHRRFVNDPTLLEIAATWKPKAAACVTS
jgi:hypothetical protein